MDALGEHIHIEWQPATFLPRHPNALSFEALDERGHVIGELTAFSVGGGAVEFDRPVNGGTGQTGHGPGEGSTGYPHPTMREILPHIDERGETLWEYVFGHEDEGFTEYLREVWRTMREAIARGLEEEGKLPGPLNLRRKAATYHAKSKSAEGFVRQISSLFSYALAVSEENAAGGIVVTAPTCGSCGVLPAVLATLQETYEITEARVLRALATAGLIGNLAKHNGSISGAEVGCQGEIGVACAMAAGAAAQLLGGSPGQIEYAAEMGLEHHLGLTCDPVQGLVQVPCIERNAVAATRAVDAATYATLSDGRHMISYDEVVDTMLQTGRDLSGQYRETSTGGLAAFYNRDELEAHARLGRQKHEGR
jgi:L-serine dehydratase